MRQQNRKNVYIFQEHNEHPHPPKCTFSHKYTKGTKPNKWPEPLPLKPHKYKYHDPK